MCTPLLAKILDKERRRDFHPLKLLRTIHQHWAEVKGQRFRRLMKSQIDMPKWLAIASVNLVTKNETIELYRNYRSIPRAKILYTSRT